MTFIVSMLLNADGSDARAEVAAVRKEVTELGPDGLARPRSRDLYIELEDMDITDGGLDTFDHGDTILKVSNCRGMRGYIRRARGGKVAGTVLTNGVQDVDLDIYAEDSSANVVVAQNATVIAVPMKDITLRIHSRHSANISSLFGAGVMIIGDIPGLDLKVVTEGNEGNANGFGNFVTTVCQQDWYIVDHTTGTPPRRGQLFTLDGSAREIKGVSDLGSDTYMLTTSRWNQSTLGAATGGYTTDAGGSGTVSERLAYDGATGWKTDIALRGGVIAQFVTQLFDFELALDEEGNPKSSGFPDLSTKGYTGCQVRAWLEREAAPSQFKNKMQVGDASTFFSHGEVQILSAINAGEHLLTVNGNSNDLEVAFERGAYSSSGSSAISIPRGEGNRWNVRCEGSVSSRRHAITSFAPNNWGIKLSGTPGNADVGGINIDYSLLGSTSVDEPAWEGNYEVIATVDLLGTGAVTLDRAVPRKATLLSVEMIALVATTAGTSLEIGKFNDVTDSEFADWAGEHAVPALSRAGVATYTANSGHVSNITKRNYERGETILVNKTGGTGTGKIQLRLTFMQWTEQLQ